MVFVPPAWVPNLPPIPDSIPISNFILNEKYGRRSLRCSRQPYTCGLTGNEFTTAQIRQRRDDLAKALGEELGWRVNEGTEFDKVAAIFCLNTIDLMMISWAIHRLNGISCPANAAYSMSELAFQLKNSRASCIFTCDALYSTALKAAETVGIPRGRIYLCPVAGVAPKTQGVKTLDVLISRGWSLSELEEQRWRAGQGKRQTAFICYSSGTSGLPKGVQISHYNIIANVLQRATYEAPWRKKHNNGAPEVVIGFLPFSHIYGLVLICHTSTYRGDQVLVLPKFDLTQFLRSIERFKIQELFVVPPVVVQMTNNLDLLKKYDLSSVNFLYTGAAPLGKESVAKLRTAYNDWNVCQAYGLTESATVVSSTSRGDLWPGSSGSLLPGAEVRIMSSDGKEIDSYDTPGEIWVKAPSVVIGYLGNTRATDEAFLEDSNGRWLKTGDEGEVRVCPQSGNEHIWIVDRIKELIKVNGNQVAPAELEAHLLSHPYVADAAVISIPHDSSGEAPKAFIVKSKNITPGATDKEVMRSILDDVKAQKAKYKWIHEVEFIDVIPKSPSGKILRRMLRDLDRSRKQETVQARL
ncbi:4-coumarate-CoA ligase, variant, partial [Cadophora sp. MPI-SDFR-AT-0126]